MTFADFTHLFMLALEAAARDAEDRLRRTVPRTFEIVLHGAGHAGDRVTPAHAAALSLGPNRFFRIIDVAVIAVRPERTTAFVRASDHRPGPFEQTWNDPPGSGPFKRLASRAIKVVPP